MFTRNFLTLACVLLLNWAQLVSAQDGPFVPCSNCDNGLDEVYPSSGPWVNTERDGSGFVLVVQNGILGGFYFGYDMEGNAQWLLFSSPLEPSMEALWHAEADTYLFNGGSCPTCPYEPPEVMSPIGQVRIEFFQRNYASFQFDNEPEQFMVPLLFGSAGFAHFPETTPYLFPELTRGGANLDAWAIVFTEPLGPMVPGAPPPKDSPPRNAQVVHFYPSEVVAGDTEADKRVIYRSYETSLTEESETPLLTIECGTMQDENLSCDVSVADGVHESTYQMPIANLGATRFIAGGPGGILEGFRVGYD